MLHRRLVYIYLLNVPSFSSRYFNKTFREIARFIARNSLLFCQPRVEVTSCFVYKVMGLTFNDRINTLSIYKIEIAQVVARRITKPQRTFSRFESHWLLFFYSFFYFFFFFLEGGWGKGGGLILLFCSCLIFFLFIYFFIIFFIFYSFNMYKVHI